MQHLHASEHKRSGGKRRVARNEQVCRSCPVFANAPHRERACLHPRAYTGPPKRGSPRSPRHSVTTATLKNRQRFNEQPVLTSQKHPSAYFSVRGISKLMFHGDFALVRIPHLILFHRHQQVIPGRMHELGASQTEPARTVWGGQPDSANEKMIQLLLATTTSITLKVPSSNQKHKYRPFG